MKGIVYSTKGETAPVSNREGSVILEIWFEDMQICVNQDNDVFRHNGPRNAQNHFGSMEFPQTFSEIVKRYLESRETLESSNPKIFTALRKKLMLQKGKHFSMDTGQI